MLGREVAIFVYRVLLVWPYAAVAVLMTFRAVPVECTLVLLSIAPNVRLWREIAITTTPSRLDPVVKRTAGLHLMFGLLYTAGILLGGWT